MALGTTLLSSGRTTPVGPFYPIAHVSFQPKVTVEEKQGVQKWGKEEPGSPGFSALEIQDLNSVAGSARACSTTGRRQRVI